MRQPKAFPSDRRERFRVCAAMPMGGRWAGRKAGSDKVVPPAASTVCVVSFRRTTSSVFPGTMQAFSGKSTFRPRAWLRTP